LRPLDNLHDDGAAHSPGDYQQTNLQWLHRFLLLKQERRSAARFRFPLVNR
jgi:hypothetical protein